MTPPPEARPRKHTGHQGGKSPACMGGQHYPKACILWNQRMRQQHLPKRKGAVVDGVEGEKIARSLCHSRKP